jgi:hypothetical protein
LENPLRTKRIEKAISLEEASVATRIPVEHLNSLEEGRPEDLPEGPYARAYLESYRQFLGLEGSVEGLSPALPDEPTSALERTSLRTVRRIATLTCLVFLGLLGWRIWQLEARVRPAITDDGPDQVVHIVARRNTAIQVIVDGVTTVDRKVAGGDTVDAAGYDRIEVLLPATENARIEYNGSVIVPQGRQDLPRRLIFIDDSEAF